MLFNSVAFVLFFCVVFLVQRRLPHRAQNLFLLAASLFFYGSWNVTLLWLIVGSATLDFVAAKRIDAASDRAAKRRWVLLSVVANLGLLGYFKYAGFFVESFVELARSVGLELEGPALDILLPVGISFYTFQSMSYSIDVFRGEQRVCKRYTDFLLYVSFFPQLVAGPIERASRLLPQIENPRERLKLGDALEGTKLIVVGVLQKVAIADALAHHVDRAFLRSERFDSLTLLLGVYAFAFQIYCDFSGYSKIARGTARLLGVRLVCNFEEPYLAANITAFWRRWHVSLSTWLRDYLYIPLGGNRKGAARTYANLMVTMLLGGLWHGASWNFVLWGGLHGLYLAVHKRVGGSAAVRGGVVRRTLMTLATFHLVCFAWIFFRAQTFGDAAQYVTGLLEFSARPTAPMLEILFYLAAGLALDGLLRRRSGGERAPARLLHLFSRNWIVETVLITLLLCLALLVGENDVIPFVYFQF